MRKLCEQDRWKTLMVALAAAACVVSSAEAATVSTTLNYLGSGGFWYEAGNLGYVSGGSGAAFGGTGEVFCFAPFMHDPDSGEVHTYEVVGPEAVFRQAAGAM